MGQIRAKASGCGDATSDYLLVVGVGHFRDATCDQPSDNVSYFGLRQTKSPMASADRYSARVYQDLY